MNPANERDERLERAVHRTLRGLPPRRAPRTLEERVLAEIARQAALPWWRQSFRAWPLPARAVLLLACAGTAKLVLMAGVWATAGFDTATYREALAQPLAWMHTVNAVGQALTGWLETVARQIPPLWLYAGLATAAAAYTAVFGLGAAAYRLLRTQR